MSLQVHVHAAIWVGDQLVVHRRRAHDREHVTLPGGRIKDRESVHGALEREVREEIGREIVIDDLLFAGEVKATSRQDVVLIFNARLASGAELGDLDLLDPDGPDADTVLPPVLGRLPRPGTGDPQARWLGDLYIPASG